jgi:DNA-binding PadR family transcriptional regulator
MRTLKYAILGLLSQQPMTGYDIAREFNDKALANFWYATHGQIYPELRKLLEEELVCYDVVIQGTVLEKKLYTITDKGRREFVEWLTLDEALAPTTKDIFRLKTYFSQFAGKEDFIEMLHKEITKHQDRLDKLLLVMKTTFPNGRPEIMTQAHGDYMVLDGALIREKTYILWLYQCLDAYGEEVPEELKHCQF